MTINTLVDQIRQIDTCEVYPPTGRPSISLKLPPDVEMFYQLTGGATLFRGADYSIEIVPPPQFVRANPIIAGDEGVGDISFDWFIIAKAGEQYITIDLASERLGRCYDSYWDRHGIPGECQIVASNFESFLEQMLKNKGGYWYWLKDSFNRLGDAYDGHR